MIAIQLHWHLWLSWETILATKARSQFHLARLNVFGIDIFCYNSFLIFLDTSANLPKMRCNLTSDIEIENPTETEKRKSIKSKPHTALTSKN